MGTQNPHEMIAITTWYLWWERRKPVHEEIVQDAFQITMEIRALTANCCFLSKGYNEKEGLDPPTRWFCKT